MPPLPCDDQSSDYDYHFKNCNDERLAEFEIKKGNATEPGQPRQSKAVG